MKKIITSALFMFSILFSASFAFAASNLISVGAGSQTGTLTAGTAGTVTYTVTVTRSGAGSLSVALSANSLPSGVTASFSPATVSFTGNTPTSNTSTLTLTSTNIASAGMTTFGISAVGDTTKTTTRTVTINTPLDTIAPVITLIGSSPLTLEAGGTYSDAGATATDNVDGNITSSIVVTNPVNMFVLGMYTVNYNVHDAAGNNALQVSRIVNVVDTTAPGVPTFVSPADNVIIQSSAMTSIDWNDVSDISSPITYVYSVSNFNTTNIDGSFTAPLYTSDTLTASEIATPSTPEGIYYYMVKAVDSVGNVGHWSAPRKVTVDNTAPVIDAVTTPITVERTHSYTDNKPEATDNVDSSVTVTTTGSVDTDTAGTYTLTYSATDTAGNVAAPVTRTINVVDTVAPKITNITSSKANGFYKEGETMSISVSLSEDVTVTGTPALTLDSGGTATYSGGTGTDTLTFDYTVASGDNSSDLNVSSIDVTNGEIKDLSSNNVEVSLPSGDNLKNNKSITIDTTAPVITAPQDETFEATGPSTTPTLTEATAVDNIDTNVDITSSQTDFSLGTTEVTWTATDDAGNTSAITSNVTIKDTTAPTLILNGSNPFDVWINTDYNEAGFTATDLVDGDVTNNVTVTENTVDTGALGTDHITYSVTDAHNNTATVTRTVYIIDKTQPIIYRQGPSLVTLEAGDTYTDEGAIALDQNGDDISANIITSGLPINAFVLGTQRITYDVMGYASTTANQAHRDVDVVDTTAPVITLTGDATINLKVGDAAYNDEGATANDIIDGSSTLTGSPSSVDTNIPGTFTITYTATDSSHNTSTATRSVIVRELGTDSTLESLTASGGVLTPIFDSGTHAYTVVLPFGTNTNPTIEATTTDSNATMSIIQVSDITSINTTERTATVSVTSEDGSSTSSYEVVFTIADAPDTTAPVITLNGESTVTVIRSNPYTEEGAVVTDNIDSGLVATITGSVDTNIVGTYTLTYSATDTAGNVATPVTRIVNVILDRKNISSGSVATNGVASANGQVLGAETFVFNTDLRLGMNNSDVVELQARLRKEGFFTYPTNTGYFGPITLAAVKAYQAAHPEIGFVTGFVGPLTRNVLNQ